MKKIIQSVSALALIGLFAVTTIDVSAAQTGFSIKANSSYSAKSSANVKSDNVLQAYVNWQSSNESSHKEWFQMVNSNNDIRSESKLFLYLSEGSIPEYDSCKATYYYYLRARREHIINPSTTVKGVWES